MASSAKYASLYDIMVDEDGRQHIAKLRNGIMTWVLDENCPSISLDIMKIGTILTGRDGNDYIVKMSNNSKCWLLNSKYASSHDIMVDEDGRQHIAKLYKGKRIWVLDENCPSTPVDILSIGDVLIGRDGNEYIVKKVNGKQQYVIHQKIYKWCKSGVLYKTLDNTEGTDSGSFSTPKRMSRNKSKKQYNK